MTKFSPDDNSVWWSNSRAAELAQGYGLLFVSKNIYEAYLFSFICKTDGIASLLGSATTEREALDLIEESSGQKLVCLISDNISPDCGAAVAREVVSSNSGSRVILILSDLQKYHALSHEKSLFHSLCAASSIGRGGIYHSLEGVFLENGQYVDPAVAQALLELETNGAPIINSRERQILTFVAEGLTNREIGRRIFIAERTVRDYVSSILDKLDIANRAGAAAWAIRHGLVAD